MAVNRAFGTLTPIVYFVNHRDPVHPEGYVLLAPYSQCPTPEGYSREEVGTLAEVDRIQKRLVEQERREWEREAQYNEALVAEKHQAVRDRLYARMVSSSTSEYEKDFIRYYLQLREEKRDRHRQRFLERTAYLYAREFDLGDRRADEERVRLDRLG